MGWRRVSNNIPSIAAVQGRRGAIIAPHLLATTSRRDVVNRHAMNYSIRKYVGIIASVVDIFHSLQLSLRPQYCPFTVLHPSLPLFCFPAKQTLKHSKGPGRRSAFLLALLLSLPVLSFLTHGDEFFGVFLSLSMSTQHSTARACPLLGSK